MKYSNIIGAVAGLVIIGACFAPWVYIESIKTTLTGLNTTPTNFGKPGLLHIILSVLAIAFFVIPAVTVKRVNVFITAFNLSWSIRTYILFSLCEFGECPIKKWGLYITLLSSILLMVASIFPRMKKQEN